MWAEGDRNEIDFQFYQPVMIFLPLNTHNNYLPLNTYLLAEIILTSSKLNIDPLMNINPLLIAIND